MRTMLLMLSRLFLSCTLLGRMVGRFLKKLSIHVLQAFLATASCLQALFLRVTDRLSLGRISSRNVFSRRLSLCWESLCARLNIRLARSLLKMLPFAAAAVLLAGCSKHFSGVLNPKGLVARQERKLIFDSAVLMMVVVIPAIIMSFAFAFRYRASKSKDYQPNWSHNNFLEAIWWGVPLVMIVILGVITWNKTHELDPYKPLAVPGKPLLIEAVSLQWKWLFIYPKEHIATVNYLQIPVDRQIVFWITSDAPMSALFIPQLGSQIYSMAGMRTQLHLIANEEGVYQGMNTQYNGDGFSDMHFKVHATSTAAYNSWLQQVQAGSHQLNLAAYKDLVKPTIANKPAYYASVIPNLFKRIMVQYTQPNMRLH